MKRKSGVEVILHPPKVPYRETITRPAEGHGRHKKQTGGHGQFADCKIRIKPLARGEDFEFVDDLYGGSIPRNYVPAVEKGIQDVRKRGFLAGFPMVDFRVELYDGQYHDVDSSELAFKIAGSLAYKDAMEKAKPTILEPIMKIAIRAPQEYMGDLMGDLTSRRGRPAGHGPGRRRLDHPRRGAARRDDLVRVRSSAPSRRGAARSTWRWATTRKSRVPSRRSSSPSTRSTGRWRSSRSSGNLDVSDLH